MTTVKVTIIREGEEMYPIIRTMDYKDKTEACADIPALAEYITNYVK